MRTLPNARRTPRLRAGFTLMELLLAAVLTALVVAIVVPFLTSQSRAVAATSGRMDALQNARFAQNAIDRELRMVGVNTLGTQPMLVQADKFAVTFNAQWQIDGSFSYNDAKTADASSLTVTNEAVVAVYQK